jgi:hypothetical protein
LTAHDAEKLAIEALERWERVNTRPMPRKSVVDAEAALLAAVKQMREARGS